jgi:hypothetical protein
MMIFTKLDWRVAFACDMTLAMLIALFVSVWSGTVGSILWAGMCFGFGTMSVQARHEIAEASNHRDDGEAKP